MKGCKNPTKLYLIRHGEVEEAFHNVFAGRLDVSLSALGKHQADILGRYLEQAHFDALYCSPMIRAQLTMAPIFQMRKLPVVDVHGFREIDFGLWTGLSWSDVEAQFGRSAFDWLQHILDGDIPGAESAESFRDRISSPLSRLIDENVGKSILVVCHGGVIRMMLSILLAIPFPQTSMFEIDYASLSLLEIHGSRCEIKFLNHTPWELNR